MRLFRRTFLVFFLAVSVGVLKADDVPQILGRLQAVATDSSLDAQGVRPWHLKVSFQMFDEQGKPGEQGTMEEWWSSPSLYRLSFTSPSYTATEIKNQDDLFRTRAATPLPYPLRALQRGLVDPMPRAEELAGTKPDLRRMTFYNIKMDCIMLDQPIRGNPEIPLGLFPTYCLDRGTSRLRVTYDAGMLEIVRAVIGNFQQRSVPIDLSISDGGKKLLSGHIALLTTDMTGASFTPTPDMGKVTGQEVFHASPGVVAGRKLSGTLPRYPQSARMNHISGAVVLRAFIGPDGHITDLRVVSTPDGDLAIAALEAVHFWTYQPYLLNGFPVAVETTITVNFNFG